MFKCFPEPKQRGDLGSQGLSRHEKKVRVNLAKKVFSLFVPTLMKAKAHYSGHINLPMNITLR